MASKGIIRKRGYKHMISAGDESPYGALPPPPPRPSIYSIELAQTICDRIAAGESMLSICREDTMPILQTVFRWLLDADKDWFFREYEKAKNVQAEHMFEQLLEIADDGTNDMMIRENGDGSVSAVVNKEVINRSRLRVDTRKWYLAKVLPKKFGDKLDVTTDGKALPMPLLGVVTKDNDLSNNHSTQEAPHPQKED